MNSHICVYIYICYTYQSDIPGMLYAFLHFGACCCTGAKPECFVRRLSCYEDAGPFTTFKPRQMNPRLVDVSQSLMMQMSGATSNKCFLICAYGVGLLLIWKSAFASSHLTFGQHWNPHLGQNHSSRLANAWIPMHHDHEGIIILCTIWPQLIWFLQPTSNFVYHPKGSEETRKCIDLQTYCRMTRKIIYLQNLCRFFSFLNQFCRSSLSIATP